MFAYTKFKIASKLLSAPQIKFTSTDSQSNGSTGKSNEPKKLNIQDLSKPKPNSYNFICGANATYMEYLFSKWIKDQNSVHRSWQLYFRDLVMSSDNAENQQKASSEIYSADGKEKDESENNYIRLFDNVDQTIARKSIKEFLDQKQNNQKSSTESAGVGTGERPPFQESDCVLGNITFNAIKEDKPKNVIDEYMSVKELIEDISNKPSNKIYRTKFDNNMTEHLKNMLRVKAALEKEPCCTKREHIKRKLELIAKKKMLKSLKQLKEDSKIVAFDCKPVEMPKK